MCEVSYLPFDEGTSGVLCGGATSRMLIGSEKLQCLGWLLFELKCLRFFLKILNAKDETCEYGNFGVVGGTFQSK